MRRISISDHKKILIDELKYITEVCDKNNIKYSLIGGSLIGAIRDGKIIPWDDDVDIILTPENFNKLRNALICKNGKYKLLDHKVSNDYFYPFSKLVNNKTVLYEKSQKNINNYGVYVDIFKYVYVSNFKMVRFFQYYYLIFLKKMLAASSFNCELLKAEKNIIKSAKNFFANKIGFFRIVERYINYCEKLQTKETNYVLSNWPAYGYKKEIQKASNFDSYKKIKFENINAMITTNYDEVLKTTFGDYMKLPPEAERKSHHEFEAYWRDENEK